MVITIRNMEGINMPKLLPDIEYGKDNTISFIDSPNSMYRIPMYKESDYFSNLESYVNFVKAVEKVVRNNDRYKKYINHLKKDYGLTFCQVLGNVSDNDADIEMHHGPILTLYDYCAIIIEYFLIKKWKISTFRIADVVLDEHQKHRVQTVMLCETIHQEVHDREIFINYKQAFGDLNAFVKKYYVAISTEYKEKINRYIDKSLIYDSNDFGILELNKTLIRIE